jgi:LmbE family N-acetylglucosaminyl deacetylase
MKRTAFPASSRVLVLAPHPDDEVLGCGGTIARLRDEGAMVEIVVVTRGTAPRYSDERVQQVRAEARAAHALLNVTATYFLDLPAAELDQVPQAAINAHIGAAIDAVRPNIVFLPFPGDIHVDHQRVFQSAMVALRPRCADYPAQIFAYETLSETNWSTPVMHPPFVPNVYIDIGATLERKLAAFGCFHSQACAFPNERSVEAIRALATMRGATVHRDAAEAFVAIREVL